MLNTLHNNGLSGPTIERFRATKATEAQAIAGLDNEHWMTPLRTAQAIEALGAPTQTINTDTKAIIYAIALG